MDAAPHWFVPIASGAASERMKLAAGYETEAYKTRPAPPSFAADGLYARTSPRHGSTHSESSGHL